MRALVRPAAMVALVVVVLAVVALLVRGRGGGPPAAGVTVTTVSPPADPRTDYRDPTTVCLRFADAVYRRDSRTDAGPQDAYRRAMAYATAELAAAVQAQPPGRDPTWAAWRSHRAATDPTVTAAVDDGDVRPADTATESYRAAHIALTPVGGDGWHGPTEQWLVLCTLRHNDGGWRVERYQISDPAGTP